MTLKWREDSPYFSYADEREDGSKYSLLTLRGGRVSYAIWVWPDERRKRTDGRELWRDVVYDGPDRDAAVAACNAHFKNRCESVNSHLVSAEQQG